MLDIQMTMQMAKVSTPRHNVSAIATPRNSSVTTPRDSLRDNSPRDVDRGGSRRKQVGILVAPDTRILEDTHRRAWKRRARGTIAKKIMKQQRKNHEVHYIDRLSRFVFPITFFISNVIYFSVCLTIS